MNIHIYNHKLSRKDLTNHMDKPVFTNHYIKIPDHIESVLSVSVKIPLYKRVIHRFRYCLTAIILFFTNIVSTRIRGAKNVLFRIDSYIPLEADLKYEYKQKDNILYLMGYMWNSSNSVSHWDGSGYVLQISYISPIQDRDEKLKSIGIC